jgi:hypothetical protein
MNARFAVALLAAVMFCGLVPAYAAAPGRTTGLVDIDIKNVPVRDAVKMIFDGRGMRYIIEPGVTGNVVELKLKGITVAEALKSLGDAAGFTYSVEDGIYTVSPKEPMVAQQPTAGSAPRARVPAQPETAAAGPPAYQMPPPEVVESPPPVTINNYIPSGGNGDMYAYAPAGYGSTWSAPYGGYYSPFFTIGPPPYIKGRWANPPPPPGWFSPDVERFLRFEWAVPTRPSFITPY